MHTEQLCFDTCQQFILLNNTAMHIVSSNSYVLSQMPWRKPSILNRHSCSYQSVLHIVTDNRFV